MKNLRFIIVLFIGLALFACEKGDENLGNLPGTWKFGSALVNGLETSADGTIIFKRKTGDIDLWFLVEADTVFKQSFLSYTETDESIALATGGEELILSRIENTATLQEFEFFETVNQVEYSIIFNLILEE